MLDNRRVFCVLVFFSTIGWFVLFGIGGCATSSVPTSSKKHLKYYRDTYHPSVQRADNIQYRSAYKYDIKGKKYKKHYKEQEKRKEKK